MQETDEDLVRDMKAGRDPAFRRFFDRYFPRVYRFCVRRLDAASAEDVTQTVMVNAIRHIGRYRGEASLFTWLCQIARNEISAHYRRNRRHAAVTLIDDNEAVRAELESLDADPELSPERMEDRRRGQEVVQLILDYLPGDYGRVLEWKYMEGYSVEEIAERLATTPVAVQSMLARARNAFRKQYAAVADEMRHLAASAPENST